MLCSSFCEPLTGIDRTESLSSSMLTCFLPSPGAAWFIVLPKIGYSCSSQSCKGRSSYKSRDSRIQTSKPTCQYHDCGCPQQKDERISFIHPILHFRCVDRSKVHGNSGVLSICLFARKSLTHSVLVSNHNSDLSLSVG
jgi:hypothetical protein